MRRMLGIIKINFSFTKIDKLWFNNVITQQFKTKLEITFTGVGEVTLTDTSIMRY